MSAARHVAAVVHRSDAAVPVHLLGRPCVERSRCCEVNARTRAWRRFCNETGWSTAQAQRHGFTTRSLSR